MEENNTSSGDNQNNDVFVVVNEEQLAHAILQGETADLAALRQVEAQSEFLLQRGQPIISTPIACRVALDQEDDSVAGDVFITSSQLLFVASDERNREKDLAIGATCITLHAMTEEPELSLYLQLASMGSETTDISEVTVTPLDSEEASQILFDGLCKLVALHPIEDDDDYNEEGGGGFFGGGDDLIWAPYSSGGFDDDAGEEGGATDEERDAMLERLDNLLVVRPEFEVQDGQFEDAEEGENPIGNQT